MNGIDVKYSLSPKYFRIGEAYQIHVETNKFRIGILTNYTEDAVTFKLFDNGDIIDFTLTLSQLRFKDYGLIKMEPDYQNGKFSNK